jgi:outer membrane biosynthesis protein TonB
MQQDLPVRVTSRPRAPIARGGTILLRVDCSYVETMHRRVEATPKQQLAELRRAYERYAALADQLKDGVNSAIDAKLQRALAQDACRIAAAYKKSVANSCARMDSMRPSEGKTTRFALMTAALALIVAIIGVTVFTITHSPELNRLVLSVGVKPALTSNSAVATKDIVPFVPAAVKPIFRALAPERKSTPVGKTKSSDRRPSVATAKSIISNSQTAMQYRSRTRLGTHVRRFPVATVRTQVASQVAVKSSAPAPGGSDSASAAPLSAIPTATMSTQLSPAYSPDANRPVELGVTQVQVSTSTAGTITDCRVVESSGSLKLDASACSLLQRNWQGPPDARSSQGASGATNVSVIWNSKAAK